MLPARLTPYAYLAVAALAYLVFVPTLSGDWVLDDEDYIVRNPVVAMPLRVWRYFRSPDALTSSPSQARMMYRPVTGLSFRASHAAGGYNPFWYHLASILLHAANACLVLLLAHRRVGLGAAALAAAALFCVHPAQAESVAYISGSRATLLSFFFCAAAYLWYEDAGRSRWRHAGSVAAFALGMLSKESSFFLLPVLAAHDFLREDRGGSWIERLRRWTPYGLVFAAFVALRWRVLGSVSQRGWWEGSLSAHWKMAAHGALQDLVNVFWPAHLRACYSFTTGSTFGLVAALSVALYAAAALAALWLIRRRHAAALPLVWALAGLFPAINVIPIEALAADRFLYVPLAGVALALAEALARIPARAAAAVGLAFVLPLAADGAAQGQVWKNQAALDFAAYAAAPSDPCAALHLGSHYYNWGMLGRAEQLAAQAMRPEAASYVRRSATIALAVIRMKQARWQDAVGLLETAAAADPRQAEPHRLMSLCWARLGDKARADAERRTARKLSALAPD
ncbi:MAG: glycosyltransferase family 39 protein [Elusimicrobia bacterium]|nr:glycosyltransferase family 39 protein [Elusimicrobiota bacterium]